MSTPGSIEGSGRIVEVIQASLVRVELPNGHRVLAFWDKRKAPPAEPWREGQQVGVVMSPFDMSRARIVKILDE